MTDDIRKVVAALQNFIKQGGRIYYNSGKRKVCRNCSTINIVRNLLPNEECGDSCKWRPFCGTHGVFDRYERERESVLLNLPAIKRAILYTGLLKEGVE